MKKKKIKMKKNKKMKIKKENGKYKETRKMKKVKRKRTSGLDGEDIQIKDEIHSKKQRMVSGF